jgi:hypothetical protein
MAGTSPAQTTKLANSTSGFGALQYRRRQLTVDISTFPGVPISNHQIALEKLTMSEPKGLDRAASPATDSPLRRHWATPVVEVFDISDTVKGPDGTESDSVGGLIPAGS